MAKRARSQSAAVVANRIRQGRGRGYGPDFKPWVLIHDVPSLGLCSRVRYKGRVAHYLSGREKQAAFDFRWNPAVLDIREQTRIDTEHTVRIAAEMGIEHPIDPKTCTPFVCSTDFVLTVRSDDGSEREMARSVKPVTELKLGVARTNERRREIARTLEKLEIERRYWVGLGVDWALLTDKDLSATRCSNIQVMLGMRLDPDRPVGFWQATIQAICEALVAGNGNTLDEVAQGLAEDGAVDPADFMSGLIWLCAERHLTFDLNRKLDLLRPVSDFAFPTIRARCLGGDCMMLLEREVIRYRELDCDFRIVRLNRTLVVLFDLKAETTTFVERLRQDVVDDVEDGTAEYLRFCARCGCTTHWRATEAYVRHAGKDVRMGVNVRLFDEALLAGVPVRSVDGRSWDVDEEWP